MNDVDAQIKQCEDDIKTLQNNLELLKKEKINNQLQNGDYGYFDGDINDPCVLYIVDGKLQCLNQYGPCNFTFESEDCVRFVKVGNVFDALRR